MDLCHVLKGMQVGVARQMLPGQHLLSLLTHRLHSPAIYLPCMCPVERQPDHRRSLECLEQPSLREYNTKSLHICELWKGEILLLDLSRGMLPGQQQRPALTVKDGAKDEGRWTGDRPCSLGPFLSGLKSRGTSFVAVVVAVQRLSPLCRNDWEGQCGKQLLMLA